MRPPSAAESRALEAQTAFARAWQVVYITAQEANIPCAVVAASLVAIPDVLFLDNGDDFNVTAGEFNQLFLSNGDGTLRYSPLLEGWLGFHHGGASADIDGNGTIDVMAMRIGMSPATTAPNTTSCGARMRG